MLVEERNDAARRLGFPTYHAMMLVCDELDETELFGLLDGVDEGTRPLFERYKAGLDARLAERMGVDVEDIGPWHYSDPFFQEAPQAEVDLDPWFEGKDLEALTRSYFEAVGFDIDELLARSDLYERDGKCQHAFCIWMDRREDIRVLANVRPTEYWMNTMLHEFGHAVYDQGVDRELPYFLRSSAHTLTTEASAMLLGRLSRNADWLMEYAGVPEPEARAAAAALDRARAASLLVATRWELVMCHFERALYADPRQNLNELWWQLVEQFPARPQARGPRRARLGREDPPLGRPGLLPELPARGDDGLAAAGAPPRGRPRRRRGCLEAIRHQPGGRAASPRAAVRDRRETRLAQDDRAGDRTAAGSRAVRRRARARGRLDASGDRPQTRPPERRLPCPGDSPLDAARADASGDRPGTWLEASVSKGQSPGHGFGGRVRLVRGTVPSTRLSRTCPGTVLGHGRPRSPTRVRRSFRGRHAHAPG